MQSLYNTPCYNKDLDITWSQGSYRQVHVKFKAFSRTSKDFPTVFNDWKLLKNTGLYVKILLLKCYSPLPVPHIVQRKHDYNLKKSITQWESVCICICLHPRHESLSAQCVVLLLKILVLENQCKIMVPLFGAAYTAPNKGTQVYTDKGLQRQC